MESGRKSLGRTVTFKPAEEDGFQIGAGTPSVSLAGPEALPRRTGSFDRFPGPYVPLNSRGVWTERRPEEERIPFEARK